MRFPGGSAIAFPDLGQPGLGASAGLEPRPKIFQHSVGDVQLGCQRSLDSRDYFLLQAGKGANLSGAYHPMNVCEGLSFPRLDLGQRG